MQIIERDRGAKANLFAIQIRKQEIQQMEKYNRVPAENEKRLFL